MNLAVITACVFPTEAPIWRLRKSCERFGIDLKPYGIGLTYTDWPDIKITKMLEHFRSLQAYGFTHVLYTDGRDSFFVAGLTEVESKYEAVGSPGCFMAAEATCYPRIELAELFPPTGHTYRWIGSGQFMGRLDYLIYAWQMLTDAYMNKPGEDQNEQGWMLDAFVRGTFGPEFVLDTNCQIFQSAGNGHITGGIGTDKDLRLEGPRVYNTVTKSYPCAVHFNGGYSDPVTGKDAVLKPVWDAIGGWPL